MKDEETVKMVYAPVIVTTLNRYEHFKRCIESLEKNTWAKYTEVYVSVDYPPEEKYEEGHGNIVKYLSNREFRGFKKLHLYFQEKNLGMAGNADFLRKKAFERFDRVIYFEDDLEVSPNYLEFMDKALEAGRQDDKIYCASGYTGRIKMPKSMKGTAFEALSCSYGNGTYRDKRDKMLQEVSVEWLDDIVYDVRKMFKIFLRSKVVFHFLLNGYIIQQKKVYFIEDGSIRPIDIVVNVYMIMNDMYSILPTVSKIRNWGMDGSGQNCGKKQSMTADKQEFDTNESFEFQLETNKFVNMLIQHRWNWIFKKVTGSEPTILCKEWLYYCYLLIRRKIEKRREQ